MLATPIDGHVGDILRPAKPARLAFDPFLSVGADSRDTATIAFHLPL